MKINPDQKIAIRSEVLVESLPGFRIECICRIFLGLIRFFFKIFKDKLK